MSRRSPKTRPRRVANVPDSERCEIVSYHGMTPDRCLKKATATVSHPDLPRAQRVCKGHAAEYNTPMKNATGWRVAYDESDRGAQ